MLTEKEVAELRNAEKVHTHWIINDKCMYDDLLDTLSAALKVVEAAKAYDRSRSLLVDTLPYLRALDKALLPFQEPRESEGK